MTTDTLSPIKTKRVEYDLTDVYNAAEAVLNEVNELAFDAAALGIIPSENYAAGMIVSQQKTAQEIFNTLAEWKKQGVQTLVTDTPVCARGNLHYRPGESLAEQIRGKRLTPS
jgi:hypothetical protein